MTVKQIVFSPTGGTQQVADIITEAWAMPTENIDLSDAGLDLSAQTFTPEDIALIALPSFGGRVPALAAQRLAAIQSGGTPCVVVCVYGNRAYEDTLVEMQDLAEQAGFRVIAAMAAVAEHSILHQYATGRPDAQDREELQAMAAKVLEKLRGNDLTLPHIPGNRPYKKAGGGGLVPKAGKDCTACGLCAQTCPAQAIDPRDPKVTDGKTCISCMRCVVRCPHSARKVNAAMVSAAALALKKACSVRKISELYI